MSINNLKINYEAILIFIPHLYYSTIIEILIYLFTYLKILTNDTLSLVNILY